MYVLFGVSFIPGLNDVSNRTGEGKAACRGGWGRYSLLASHLLARGGNPGNDGDRNHANKPDAVGCVGKHALCAWRRNESTGGNTHLPLPAVHQAWLGRRLPALLCREARNTQELSVGEFGRARCLTCS